MMQLFLEAVDVWLFRDGRPFDAFADHRARSLFPPYPSVMQGVIRSHHLVTRGVDLHDQQKIAEAVGTAGDYRDLLLRGPFLARRDAGGSIQRLLSVPANALPVGGDGSSAGYRSLRPRKRPAGLTTSADQNVPMLLLPPDQQEPSKERAGDWISEENVREFLTAKPQEVFGALSSATLYQPETRLGIGRDDAKRVTKEMALYEAEFIRPQKDVGLLVEVEGYDGWSQTGVLRIGGEGRAAIFEQVNGNIKLWREQHPMPDPLPRNFVVYFATPTHFDGGWRPGSNNWGAFFEGHVELQAAAFGRYQSLGGFDWATNRHKTARRFVPSGAVYFFYSDGTARLKVDLPNRAITHYGPEIGFGQVIILPWKE
jgi:CRISPR-associated protein Cmr3